MWSSIASDLDPKLIPKELYKIMMRKVYIIIQSLLSHRPNHHSGYSYDCVKHHTLLTLKRRQNIVYDVADVEQHELLGFDASRPLPDVIQERKNLLAVEGSLSRFFHATTAASTIGHVCQASSEVQTEKGQRVPWKSPCERELRIVQKVRTWHPISMGADLLRRPAAPLTERVWSGANH